MKTSKVGNKVLISSDNQYFDDCPICQAMRKAEKEGKSLDPVELAKAFNKANKMGGITGGVPEKTQE